MQDINQYLVSIDYIAIFAYIVVIISIGYWVSFRQNKNRKGHLFLAENSLRWHSIGLTMWGTNVGPSLLVASAASGFTTGIAGANFSWYAFPFIMLLGLVFAPFYRKTKISTLPEFIGIRYGETSRNILAWYSLVTILISWLGLTLYAGGILVTQILNWPLWLSLILLISISAFFTLAGGLETIAATNVFQMIFLIVMSLALVIVGIQKAGGPVQVYQAIPENYWHLFRSDSEDYPWQAILLGYPVLGIWFWCTDQSMVQSAIGAKSLKEAQKGTNLIGWLKVLDMPLFILPGILCIILFPNLSQPEEAYATMVVNLFPSGLVGLIMAVLIAALISTIDSALNSLSTIFTLDIYGKNRPQINSKKVISVGRLTTVIASILGVLIALGISNIKGDLFILFQSILGFIAPPMASVFLVGVLWKKASSLSANVILTIGSLISFTLGIMTLFDWPSNAFWPHSLLMSFYLFCLFVAIMIVVSIIKPNVKVADFPSLSQTLSFKKTGSQIIYLWVMLALVTTVLYIFFN